MRQYEPGRERLGALEIVTLRTGIRIEGRAKNIERPTSTPRKSFPEKVIRFYYY